MMYSNVILLPKIIQLVNLQSKVGATRFSNLTPLLSETDGEGAMGRTVVKE